MAPYKKMYLALFNAVTDALEALEETNYGQAKDLLRRAQQNTEEWYLDQPDSGAN